MKNGFYPCEYMYEWVNFRETTLKQKGNLYGIFNKENVKDVDYNHAKKSL